MAFPGAKLEGDFNHLSRFPSVHLMVAFDDKADEYAKPSFDAIFCPGRPPRAGPTEFDFQTTENIKVRKNWVFLFREKKWATRKKVWRKNSLLKVSGKHHRAI